MNFPLSFSALSFALAGLACAVGPVLIHLLHRRRYRTVHWAAMDFLLVAMQRNRRIVQIRDIILLLMRTAAILLFGLALARPYLSSSQISVDPTQPLHAILVVDNSLSMGYQLFEGTVLDRAKGRAREYIRRLPSGSIISVVPLCGSRRPLSPDPYRTTSDALEALQSIALVDSSASIQMVVTEVAKASKAAPQLSKRTVFFSDNQALNWNSSEQATDQGDLPPMQIVNVSPGQRENSWIADLRLQDELADIETPATIIIHVRHRGLASRRDIQATLSLADVELASKTVTLEAGDGDREISFDHVFDSYRPEPGKPVLAPLKASITADRLPADDVRFLTVPVVAGLPVLFVDQYGTDEDPLLNRLGETRHLRKLLSPTLSRNASARQLIKVRHIRLDQLNQDLLSSARLVVVAGIKDPGEKVSLLRQYVVQGGQLMIAAGADFDPVAWTDIAWKGGQGILPAPLKPIALGATPEEASQRLVPFFLSYQSMSNHEYFQLSNVSEEELRDLYSEPFFFKAVEVDLDQSVLDEFRLGEIERLADEHRLLSDIQSSEELIQASSGSGPEAVQAQAQLEQAREQWQATHPQWLLWRKSDGTAIDRFSSTTSSDFSSEKSAAELQRHFEDQAKANSPRVLARFTNSDGAPYLVERSIGSGRVLFASSGLLSSWNTLAQTNAVMIYDRILRSMIRSTLPQHNYSPQKRIVLPLDQDDRDVEISLTRPNETDRSEILDIGFVGKDHRGVTIDFLLERGFYRLVAKPRSNVGGKENRVPRWEIPLAVNGDSEESNLQPLDPESQVQLSSESTTSWVAENEPISLAGVSIRGQNSWRYLVIVVLALLFIELGMLSWPALKLKLLNRQKTKPA